MVPKECSVQCFSLTSAANITRHHINLSKTKEGKKKLKLASNKHIHNKL